MVWNRTNACSEAILKNAKINLPLNSEIITGD